MAIVYRNSTTGQTSSSGNANLGDVADGTISLIGIITRGTGGFGPSSTDGIPFIPITGVLAEGIQDVRWWSKNNIASPNRAFNIGVTGHSIYVILNYDGVDTVDPIADFATLQGIGSTVAAPSISGINPLSRVVAWYAAQANTEAIGAVEGILTLRRRKDVVSNYNQSMVASELTVTTDPAPQTEASSEAGLPWFGGTFVLKDLNQPPPAGTVWINDDGTVKKAEQIFIKDQTIMKEVLEVWINDDGTNKLSYLKE